MCEWRTIKDFEDYEVSSDGQVYSHLSNKILSPGVNSNGYLIVGLCKNGKRSTKRIHRLVAAAFIPNPDNLPQVNHIDEDKFNNHVENLEWCGCKYNNNYGTRNERVAKSLSKPVAAYTKNGELVTEYPSLTAAAEAIEQSISSISNCLTGRANTCAGYIWKYI